MDWLRHPHLKIAREIRNEPYGFRDLDIEDCNGYRVAFGQPLELPVASKSVVTASELIDQTLTTEN